MVTSLETRPPGKPSPVGTPSNVGDELAKIPQEPFLAVEKRLVAWSLILGVALLGFLIWVSERFFSG